MIDKTNVETSDELACTDRDWTPRGIVMISRQDTWDKFYLSES